MVKVAVKWNKRVFADVEVTPTVADFKAKLQELTGVPAARQKLMARGAWKGILKDDVDLSGCTIKDGQQQVTLMGTAEVLAAPTEKVQFMEDMKTEDLAQSGAVLPAGLVNLGNTCYMNSTLQCMRKVPELREALTSFRPTSSGSGADPGANLVPMFTASLRETFNAADRSTEAIPPAMFVQVLRQLFPQFAQQGPRGGFMQQDAEELYSSVVNTLSQSLKKPTSSAIKEGDTVLYTPKAEGEKEGRAKVIKVHPDSEGVHYTILPEGKDAKEKNTTGQRISKVHALTDLGNADNVMDALFGLEMEEEFTCEESGESKVSTSTAKKLVCNIQGGAGASTQINHLADGMKVGLSDKVEKHSDKLGRDAVFTLNSKIKRLPRYLCIQVLRFFWKATPDSMDHQGVKCKIMRPVTFPSTLDMFEFCSPSLQSILKVPRDAADKLIFEQETKEKAAKEAKIAEERAEKEKAKKGKVFAHLSGGGGSSSTAKPPAPPAPEAEKSAAEGVQESKDMEVDSAEPPAAPATPAAKAAAPAEGEGEELSDDLKAALAMSMQAEDAGVEGAAGPGLPADFKGTYELFAVVTHKGREADGGHYMGWVRQEGDDWLVFDDSDVSPCKTEDIMNLKGGGDWHMAYLTFYRFKE
ncbi:unnamed protein product [Ectocarpus sp. 4 AP-2014]